MLAQQLPVRMPQKKGPLCNLSWRLDGIQGSRRRATLCRIHRFPKNTERPLDVVKVRKPQPQSMQRVPQFDGGCPCCALCHERKEDHQSAQPTRSKEAPICPAAPRELRALRRSGSTTADSQTSTACHAYSFALNSPMPMMDCNFSIRAGYVSEGVSPHKVRERRLPISRQKTVPRPFDTTDWKDCRFCLLYALDISGFSSVGSS